MSENSRSIGIYSYIINNCDPCREQILILLLIWSIDQKRWQQRIVHRGHIPQYTSEFPPKEEEKKWKGEMQLKLLPFKINPGTATDSQLCLYSSCLLYLSLFYYFQSSKKNKSIDSKLSESRDGECKEWIINWNWGSR